MQRRKLHKKQPAHIHIYMYNIDIYTYINCGALSYAPGHQNKYTAQVESGELATGNSTLNSASGTNQTITDHPHSRSA